MIGPAVILAWLQLAPVEAAPMIRTARHQLDAAESVILSTIEAAGDAGFSETVPGWLRVQILQEWQISHPLDDITPMIRAEILEQK